MTAAARRTRAERVVARTIAELPPELHVEAAKVPCLFQEFDAEDPELLGTYGEFSEHEISGANGPIVLYLAAIETYAQEENLGFDDEVRITYLHELGHHFGWGEGELEERGLA